jgi:hypothetical protein
MEAPKSKSPFLRRVRNLRIGVRGSREVDADEEEKETRTSGDYVRDE